MTTIRLPSLAALLLAATLPWLAAAADDEDALRKRALALNDVTGTDSMENQLKALLKEKDKDRTKKLLELARKMAGEKDQPFNANAAFVLARVAQELKDIDSAEVMYRLCIKDANALQSGQKLAASLGGLIDTYYENKRFDSTVKLCKEFMAIQDNPTVDQLKPAIVERMIQAMARQGKVDDALKLVENFVEAEKDGWRALQLKGWVLREGERYDDAAKVYETVLDRIANDKALKPEAKERFLERNRYVLSGVYVDLKRIDKAAEQLQTLLKNKPDNSTFNNDLGYIWADHDMNLDEAEKLIRKAIDQDRKEREKLKAAGELPAEFDKDNAAYLDSLGWVLFKKKQFEEAKKYLLQAVEDPEGQHIEIMDHLGDVHMVLKEKDKAIAIWKKAVEMPVTSKRERERKEAVEKKLKEAEK